MEKLISNVMEIDNREPTTDNREQITLIYIGNQLSTRGGTPTSIDTLTPLLREEGFDVKTASAKKNKLLRLIEMLLLVYRNKRTTRFVLIDTYSTQNFWYAYAVASLCQKLHLKYIPILHGGELPTRLENSPKVSKKVFEKAFLNVAPSLYLNTVFQQKGFFNVQYIPNSIHLENYPFKERNQLRPRLLWVRAFAEIYNPLQAVKVLELLLPDYPDAELCMVGPVKDDSWQNCIRYSRLHSLPVRFMGRLPKEEWIALSKAYDIFLNTTNIDNTPVSVIEAMALGLPVVSTNAGGLPYLITADIDGMLVPPNDPELMAEAIKNMLKRPEHSLERTRAARKKVEVFDWERVKVLWKEVLAR
ncbi:glycosyltransferase family 4 protein [Salinimicrobium sp. MT39]|uniref:Glycosyltransferase family 4 protein n=1 Tax=Salinimicrobium profundisediminis TaxID=2994553 RepID=A0A9X3CVA2_9FLAO|nr:glycosyltransferase family 4 protein [Salinimicrobium profundisediminis]MCX2837507.1 glycosyltransferase family 4 protein [Salinimicrobium profundisediminis]